MSDFSTRHFFDSVIQHQPTVEVYLTNGVRLQGRIIRVDGDDIGVRSFVLKREGVCQLINNNAVSTIRPNYEVFDIESALGDSESSEL